MALLEVSHLGVGFRGSDGEKDNTAVDDVSFALEAGEVLGVVGESGSGKSVTALSILGLLRIRKRITCREVLFGLRAGNLSERRKRNCARSEATKSPLFFRNRCRR